MTEYRYILADDLPQYEADGWEYVGPMKGEKYNGGHPDTMIVKREVTDIASGGLDG